MGCELINIYFEDACQLGDLDLSDGFEFYVEAKVMEEDAVYSEDVEENELNMPEPIFQRYELKYLLTTKLIPHWLVDVFRLLQYCSDVVITEEEASYNAYNITITETWQFEDREMATIAMEFTKQLPIIKTGCCIDIKA